MLRRTAEPNLGRFAIDAPVVAVYDTNMGFLRLLSLRCARRLRRLILTIGALASIGFVVAAWWLLHDLPDPATIQQRVPGPTAKIYDRHGNLLYEVLPPDETAGARTPVPFERFPLALRQATIATEDAAFYSHPGFDWRGILRAARINLSAGRIAAGGSTITQQVARNLLLEEEERLSRDPRRKLREIVLAVLLERRLSKDEILELYLNQTYYGNLAYGAEAAAQAYFGKHVWELDIAECALLAGLPQAPALYNPLTDLEAAKARQADVLRLMVKAGYLSPSEAELAAAERLQFAASPFAIEAPHFVMWVLQQVEARHEAALIDGSGLKITTTLDLGLQDIAEGIVRRRLDELSGRARGTMDRNVRNAALVAMNPSTGEILAMVGSPDYFNQRIDGAVNAALMPRQPGSALKPITYATAFDPSRTATPWSPATVVSDVPTTFITGDGKLYEPQNYDRTHHGPITLREALATSNNIVAVKVLEHVGVDAMIRTARDLGITTLNDPERYDLTVTLGGGEVTLLELTGAYATLANNGTYQRPVAILRIEDAQGRVLEQFRPGPGRQALDPRVAALVTDILSDPKARAPAFGEWNPLRLTRPAAAKTGTTTDWRDNWTVGYTPDLAVGVWVGNADNEPMRDVSGIDGAGPIWHDFMQEALKHQRPQPFVRPDGIVEVEVCTASGLLPSALCPQRRRELFLTEQVPTAVDDSYRLVRVDRATGLLAGPACEEEVEERLFRIPPPEALVWAQQNGWPLPPTRTCSGTVAESESADGGALVIVTPAPGAVYRLDPSQPAASQRLPLAVRAADGQRHLTGQLLLDGRPLANFETLPFEYLWPLTPGQHRLTALLDSAPEAAAEVTFTVHP